MPEKGEGIADVVPQAGQKRVENGRAQWRARKPWGALANDFRPVFQNVDAGSGSAHPAAGEVVQAALSLSGRGLVAAGEGSDAGGARLFSKEEHLRFVGSERAGGEAAGHFGRRAGPHILREVGGCGFEIELRQVECVRSDGRSAAIGHSDGFAAAGEGYCPKKCVSFWLNGQMYS